MAAQADTVLFPIFGRHRQRLNRLRHVTFRPRSH